MIWLNKKAKAMTQNVNTFRENNKDVRNTPENPTGNHRNNLSWSAPDIFMFVTLFVLHQSMMLELPLYFCSS